METAYLETFLLVVEAGSMSAAARRLGLTPAAVAQQLQVLERELGGTVLQRVGRTVRPTEAGARLGAEARAALDRLEALKSTVRADADATELRLGSINTALHSVLPDILERLVRAHPDARVTVRSALSDELHASLQRGELDAAICLYPSHPLPKSTGWAPLREESLAVWAPARWQRRDPHQLLREEPFIRYDRQLGGGREAERYLRRMRIVPRERFELTSLAAIALLVDRGLGVSLAPDTVPALSPGLQVARLPLPERAGTRRFGIAWPRASVRLRAIERFVAEARRVAEPERPRAAPARRRALPPGGGPSGRPQP